MSVISFSIVFIVCIGLMLMMMALKRFSDAMEKAAKAKEVAQAPAAATTQPGVAQMVATPPVSASSGDDEELVAVITAAIVASCGAGAKILSITPASARHTSGAWRMTGRLQNFEGVCDSI